MSSRGQFTLRRESLTGGRGAGIVLGGLCWSFVAAYSASAQSSATQTFSEAIDVRVVEIEVEVRNADDFPAIGLARDQFRLLVDGKPREIEYFSEIAAGYLPDSPSEASSDGSMTQAGSSTPETEPLNILVFIDNAYSMKLDRDRTLAALDAQLAMLRPQDRIAIVAWDGRRIDLVLPWTTPGEPVRAGLQEVIASRTNGLRERGGLGWVGGAERVDPRCGPGSSAQLTGCASSPGANAAPSQRVRAIEVRQKLDAVAIAVASALRSVPPPPGRRVAALLSGGWTSEVIEPGDMLNAWKPVLQAADQLRYALYPVDVPGMSQAFSATVDREEDDTLGTGATGFSSFPDDSGSDEKLVHSTLHHLANETGGVALVNAGRKQVFSQISGRARSYYSLGFSAPIRHDDSSHDIRVEVGGGAFRVKHRRAFQDLDRATEARIALEATILGSSGVASAPGLRVSLGEAISDGKKRVRVPVRLRMQDSEPALTKSYDLRLIAEDAEGKRTEIGPVAATLRRRDANDPIRGGDVEMVLRRAPHTLAISLWDGESQDLFVARVEFVP